MQDTSDILITHGTLLTMNRDLEILEDAYVLIRGDSIRAMGTVMPDGLRASRVIDAKGGLVLPGLVNGHTHAAMTLFRGLADDLPLMEWLNHYIFPVERRMDADFVYTGTLLACAEMILSGTTTFLRHVSFRRCRGSGRQGCRGALCGGRGAL